MRKICAKCGFSMQEDDFLCPQCGAIWGDTVYQKPVPEPACGAPEGEKAEEASPPNRLPKWFGATAGVLMLLLVFSVLLCVAFRHRMQDMEAQNGQNTLASSTSTSNPDYIFTIPAGTESEYITYTITFLNPQGNPIPNVSIMNPYAYLINNAVEPYVSDANGTITFTAHEHLTVGIRILEVPSRYFWNNDGSTLYFLKGETEMVITLDFAEQHTHSVTMLDPDRLIVPLENQYIAGETIRMMVDYDADAGFMLFCNGVEVPVYYVSQGDYWEFQLEMPEEDIILDLKVYSIVDLPMEHELLIKAFYREFPDLENVSIFHYYGQFEYGAIVAMFHYEPCDMSEDYSEYIAGCRFLYYGENRIWVFKNSEFYHLRAAYIRGSLDNVMIEQIYQQHIERFPELYTDVEEPTFDNPE